MNYSTKNNQPNFKKGYGKFPYVIEWLCPGTYRQIPIVFNVEKSSQYFPGEIFNIDDSHKQFQTLDLIKIYQEELVQFCSEMIKKLEKEQQRSKRICLVLGPNEAIYFENQITTENICIPSGGWLWGVDGSTVTKSIKHYIENQNPYFEQTNSIEQRFLHISGTDEEKIEIIKQNPSKFYIGENSYLSQGEARIIYLKKMLVKSIMKEDYEICIKIKEAIVELKS